MYITCSEKKYGAICVNNNRMFPPCLLGLLYFQDNGNHNLGRRGLTNNH